MSRIVMKFGGTSVGSVERIKNVSNIVKNEFDKGNQIVVVLSAMAGETDRLIGLTKDISEEFKSRKLGICAYCNLNDRRKVHSSGFDRSKINIRY